ncbi:tape-measure protein [Streptomyces sp. Je 1-79]|uniref:tape-measure protein n=1 Tax=Streptomyces sp. Je 1-79 TaxID=2943847 RepID=UPI0021A309B5|nr:tape-measure protein [Streptomyces sp. Je 1-79]MCT4355838.1 tape-measure protein [Streptomyces sp. Je 1-79]
MSAALAAQANGIMMQIRGLPGAMKGFRGQVQATNRVLDKLRGGLTQSASAVDRIKNAATPAATQVQQVKARTDASAQSLARVGRTATTTAPRLKSVGTKAKGSSAPLKSIASGGSVFGTVAGLLGKASGALSRIMGVLGKGLSVAAGVMTGVNVAMRANPLGFLAGLIVPLLAALITYAMNTETGQRIMKQVFDQVQKTFQDIFKFLGPVVSAYGTVVAQYFKAVQTIIDAALKVIGAAVSGDFGKARDAISGATRALSDLVRRPWNSFRTAIQPTLDWITKKIPDMFTRVKDATSRTLGGIGDFMSTGLQTLAGVITGPIKGLIAFANWVIDGLNSLSFSLLGKKFGVDLSKIPQLAEGGVVHPSPGGGASAVRPLSSLERLRPAEAGHRAAAAPHGERARLHTYREPAGRSAHAIAEDLLFLHRTAA